MQPTEQVKRDIAKIAASSEGKSFLAFLCEYTGFFESEKVVSPSTHELNLNATIYNVVLRGVWADLRQYIPVEDRIKIEHPELREEYIQPCPDTTNRSTTQTQLPELQMAEPEEIQEPLHRARHRTNS